MFPLRPPRSARCRAPLDCGAAGLALNAMALLPLIASPYAVVLMLPFIAYGIALLGFNLLFGTTGALEPGTHCFSASAPTPLRC